MSTNTTKKAHSYLTGGKVQVKAHNSQVAVFHVSGSASKPYTVMFGPTGWECNCPAYAECAHVVAAKLISPLRYVEPPKLAPTDDELAHLLRAFEPE